MKEKVFVSRVGQELAPKFEALGFTYFESNDSFDRDTDLLLDRVTIDAIKWRSSECILLNFQLGLRFHKIEEILNGFRLYLEQTQRGSTFTINKFFGELMPEGTQDQLVVSDERDIPSVCKVAFEAFRNYGLPYFERFSDLDRVCLAFQEPPANWPTQDRLRRYEFLLAFYLLKRNKKAFNSLASEVSEFGVKYKSGFHKLYLQAIVNELSSKLQTLEKI